ncbi:MULTISPECIES: hypothetical protein [unclassified Microcoleus]|uniref:hypothetical protein n=1 Tax=unclassified Microcoleus TaxID=2642155 RepID=UPI002FD21719
MATDKKHIAVYLDRAVEDALTEFCTANGMESKKGPMYSAAVNKALAQFFGIDSTTPDNRPSTTPDRRPSTTPDRRPSTTPDRRPSTTPDTKVAQRLAELENQLSERFGKIEERLGKLRVASDAPAESLRPDIAEIEALRQSLGKCDGLVKLRNQEISALNCRLALRDETIAELGEQIDRLESSLASREPTQLKTSVAIGTDLSKVEAADVLNQLKARRKKSKADLADVETLLEILSSES